MPGFGQGSFGSDPYGEYRWSRRVLYEYMPELYRLADVEEGGLLEAFAESLRPLFDELRHRVRDLDTLRDPFQVRTQYDEVYSLLLGPVLAEEAETEQSGINGSVNAIYEFNAPAGRFGVSSVGKELIISGSTVATNNKTVTLTTIVDSTTVLTYPPLAADAGPLVWELRPVVEPPENVVTVEVRGGSVAAIAPGFILNDGYADFEVLARRQFKQVSKGAPLLTEKEGSDGYVNGAGDFISPTVALTQLDVGKKLTLTGSTIPENVNRFEITDVQSATTATVQDPDGNPPQTDAGLLNWALLPREQLDLFGTIEPRGAVEQEGVDLAITVGGPPATVVSTSAEFTAEDVGKRFTIRGSTTGSNNTTLTILSFVSANSITLGGTLTVDAGPLVWEVRRATTKGSDLIDVSIRAPSLITHLAGDFGIEVDTQESEKRQRSWVRNVSQWVKKKGVPEAYEIIGSISGFDVEVSPLYRVTAALSSLIPAGDLYEIGETATGRSGTDGSLPTMLGAVQFSSPTAVFRVGDVGSHIRVQGTSGSTNDKLYTIANFIDVNTVEFGIGDTATFPEVNNGSLQWAIVRLYADDLPPSLPSFDDFDADYMEDIIDGFLPQTTDYFGVDKYCWESDFYADIEIVIASVVQIASGRFQVTTSDGPAQGPSSIVGHAGVIKAAQRWNLVEGTAGSGFGQSFRIETVPVLSGPNYTFEIAAASGPATGGGTLRYVCSTADSSCDYCKASKILARITAGSIATESGVAVERVLERVLSRLEEATPTHVELVPVFAQTLQATVNISVTVLTP